MTKAAYIALFGSPKAATGIPQWHTMGGKFKVRVGPNGNGTASNLIFHQRAGQPSCGCHTANAPRHRPGPFIPRVA